MTTHHASIDNLLDIDLAVARLNDFGSVVELLDQVKDTSAVFLANHVDLVENDHICELDLVDHQVADCSFVFWRHIVTSSRE